MATLKDMTQADGPAPATGAGIALRCSCGGKKKAAVVHPRRDLTIVFGHDARHKHRLVVEPLELLRLLSGCEDESGIVAFVEGLFDEIT